MNSHQSRIEAAKKIFDVALSCQSEILQLKYPTNESNLPADLLIGIELLLAEEMTVLEMLRLTNWIGEFKSINGVKVFIDPNTSFHYPESKKREEIAEDLMRFFSGINSHSSTKLTIIPLNFIYVQNYSSLPKVRAIEINESTLPYKFSEMKRYLKIKVESISTYISHNGRYREEIGSFSYGINEPAEFTVDIKKVNTTIEVDTSKFLSTSKYKLYTTIEVGEKTNVLVYCKCGIRINVYNRIGKRERTISVHNPFKSGFAFLQNHTKEMPF